MRDRATLVITHRLVNMEDMDEILVLDAGRIVERGTHEVLLCARGLYRRMVEVQKGVLVTP
jgi:ATP-binding cassette subfamily B protein